MNSFERYVLDKHRDELARALHGVFEGWVCHLPAEDPDWVEMADEVIVRMSVHRDSPETA